MLNVHQGACAKCPYKYMYFLARNQGISPFNRPSDLWFILTQQSYTPFISPNSQSLRTELRFQFIRFAAAILQCASVCFHTEHRISAFWKVRFKKRSKIEQKDPNALFGLSLRIIRCTLLLEYASKTPLEVVADLPHKMRLF